MYLGRVCLCFGFTENGKGLELSERSELRLSGSARNMSWIGKSRKAFVAKKVEGRLSGNHASSITG